MSKSPYSPVIPRVPTWRRPPWACPKCFALLPAEYQPRHGLEAYGVKCPKCAVSIRFVRETVRGEGDGKEIGIWVAALATDRFSRTAHRRLTEPNPMDWCPGGFPGGGTGTADPTAAFYEYPGNHEALRVKHRWQKSLGNDPLVSVSAVQDELWVVTSEGDLYVLRAPADEGLATLAPSEPKLVQGSPKRLAFKSTHPPAHCGGWWFFAGGRNEAVLIERSPRTPNDMTTWVERRCVVDRGWEWVGGPIAITGRDCPTFSVLANDGAGHFHLAVFEVRETIRSSRGELLPVATVALPRCRTIPVQVPRTAATVRDTNDALRGPDAWILGSLLWNDVFGSLHAISTAPADPQQWISVQLADDRGMVARTHDTPVASGPALPPPPGRSCGPALPPPPGSGPALPPPPGSGPALPPPPGSGPALPPPPGRSRGPALPPPPGSGPALPPPPGRSRGPALPPPPAARTAPNLPPPPGRSSGTGPARYRETWDDQVAVSVAPFYPDQVDLPGVRVWTVAKPKLNGDPMIRSLSILGGDSKYPQQGWDVMQAGSALASVAASRGKSPTWLSVPPVFYEPRVNDLTRQQDPFIQPIVVGTPAATSVFDHANRVQERDLQRPSADKMPMACAPVVTPIGVLAIYRRRMEFWTFEKDGTSRVATFPASADHGGADSTASSLVVQEHAQSPIHPAVIGNNVWIPSESGTLYCLSVLPVSRIK